MSWNFNSGRIIRGVVIFLLLTVFAATQGNAQDAGSFEDPAGAFERAFQEQSDAFDQTYAALDAEWRAWAHADSVAFDRFRAEVTAIWGDYRGTTKTDWVEYADDLSSRSVVDFESGTATVEVLLPASAGEEEQKAELRKAVSNMVQDRGKTRDYPVLDQPPRPLGNRPVLADLLKEPEGKTVTVANADSYAMNLVSSAPVVVTKAASTDKVARIRVKVTTPLVPNHLKVLAEKYRANVRRYADLYGLDTRLVMAVIHTESYFNPKAQSAAPAFGLMQLVPSTGGRDAYEFLTGQAVNPSLNELYDPERNIELGCAYLALIKDRYLAGIDDLQSRLYCTICAYNTGAGNVSRAFTGANRVKPAVEKINALPPERVLAVLQDNLPAQETRNYIVKVLERVKFYQEWQN